TWAGGEGSPWVRGMRSWWCSAGVRAPERLSPGGWWRAGHGWSSPDEIPGDSPPRRNVWAAPCRRPWSTPATALRSMPSSPMAWLLIIWCCPSAPAGLAGGPFLNLSMADLAAAVDGKLVAYLSVLQASL